MILVPIECSINFVIRMKKKWSYGGQAFCSSICKKTIRNGFELFAIAFAILLPLAATAFAALKTDMPIWEIVIFGIAGTLIWWFLCWFAFWVIVE